MQTSTEICDDIVLQTWSRASSEFKETSNNLLLIGDSQMGMMASVLEKQGIRFAGGAIMNASDWINGRFELRNDGSLFMPALPESRQCWERVCSDSLLNMTPAQIKDATILTNIGTHTCTHMVSGHFDEYLKSILGFRLNDIPIRLLGAFLLKDRILHLMLIRKMVDAGYRVIWISDPPTQRKFQEIFEAFDTILCDLFQQAGCHVFSARTWAYAQAQGKIPDRYRATEIDPVTNQPDWIHGSTSFYQEIFEAIATKHSIKRLQNAM